MTHTETALAVWLGAQTLWLFVICVLGNNCIRGHREARAFYETDIDDLRGQIDRMMLTARNNDEGERLWAARRPDGSCARKLKGAE